MSMDVKVTTPPIQVAAAIRADMVAAAEPILAAAVAEAPYEPEPRHGVHLNETGFVRYAQPEAGADAVAVGFGAYWARFQEVNEEYHHEHGHAHFLETAMIEGADAWLARVNEAIRARLAEGAAQ